MVDHPHGEPEHATLDLVEGVEVDRLRVIAEWCDNGHEAIVRGVDGGEQVLAPPVRLPTVNRPIMPAQIAPPAARYVHAVLTEQPQMWLHTSGVVPIAPDGTVPDDLADQAEVVWTNIEAMLVDAGMSASDIVSVTTYVVVGEPLGPVMAVRDRVLGQHRAASTLVTVPALARPEWRMEIAIVAAR
jgi:enamine deaminase RidA (YjgF/YER057c/UK114 family)